MALRYLTLFIWFVSGVFFQILYILLPLLGALPSLFNNLVIKFYRLSFIYFWLLISMCFIFAIQTFGHGNIEMQNINGILRYVAYFGFSLYILNNKSDTIKKTIYLIINFILVTTPFGIYQVLSSPTRYRNIFDHANHFAYVLVLISFFLLEKFHRDKDKKQFFFLIIVMVINLILTNSNGALLTFGLLVLYYIFFRFNISKSKKSLLIFLGLFGVISILLFTESRFEKQFVTLQSIDIKLVLDKVSSLNFGGYGSGVWRLVYWLSIIKEFVNENFFIILFGHGFDDLSKGNFIYSFMYTDPHNDYIKLLVEVGLVGMTTYIVFLIFLVKEYKNIGLGIVLFIPMVFGNIIVNFPYNLTLLMVLSYFQKSRIVN